MLEVVRVDEDAAVQHAVSKEGEPPRVRAEGLSVGAYPGQVSEVDLHHRAPTLDDGGHAGAIEDLLELGPQLRPEGVQPQVHGPVVPRQLLEGRLRRGEAEGRCVVGTRMTDPATLQDRYDFPAPREGPDGRAVRHRFRERAEIGPEPEEPLGAAARRGSSG